MVPTISKSSFGKTPDGEAFLFSLKNKNGMEAKITNYGGIITHLFVPDKNGKLEDVVLGFDNLDQYLESHPYFGAIVGRYGNRIAHGKFSIDGTDFFLVKNNGEHHLHGGTKGLDKVLWEANTLAENGEAKLELTYTSPHLEEGYPGNLKTKVTYTLTNSNELKIEYEATTDQATVCNLTNHSYFNLAGAGNGDIMNHEVMVDADFYTGTDEGLIPTGELIPVDDTVFDLRKYTVIKDGMDAPHPQIQYAKGYDTNFVLNKKEGELAKIASVRELTSGRVMDVFSTEPGVQLYCGNWLDVEKGKGGKAYPARSGLCLETQHFPDSPNQEGFPSTVLRPGEVYRSVTVYVASALAEGNCLT